ncbi:MAG: hypothetical protein JNM30_14195 [Rhodospirillales bacterium]|nr:hypothetical protein [Rhodospirillales bacterium]
MRLKLAVAAAALVLAAVAGPTRAADPPTVGGTRIALSPPPGFEPSSDAAGFVNRRAGASIVVAELPVDKFRSVRNAVQQAEVWKKGGMELVQVHRLDGFPYEHTLAQARRMHEKTPVDVWTLVVGQRDLTATVVVNVSQGTNSALPPDQVKKLLAGVRIAAAPADPMLRLPFTISPPARFTYRQAVGDRQVMLKESPLPPVGVTDDITAWAGMVPQVPAKPEQREMFARQHLFAQKNVQIELLDPPKVTTVAGMPALEMMGQGRNAKGEQRRVFVVMAFGAKSSYVVQAMAPERRLDSALAELQALARSLKPK